MDPTPGWGLGNAAPAPAGTSAVLVGAGAATATPLGITMVDTATSPPMAPRIQDVCQVQAAVVLLRDERLGDDFILSRDARLLPPVYALREGLPRAHQAVREHCLCLCS